MNVRKNNIKYVLALSVIASSCERDKLDVRVLVEAKLTTILPVDISSIIVILIT